MCRCGEKVDPKWSASESSEVSLEGGNLNCMKNYSSAALATQAGVGGVSQKFCYGLAMAFLQTPLRRFGFRTPSITRFDSSDVYIADRVTDTSAYVKLFQRFTSFEGKTVLDLGCNTGYLLHSFLQSERFTAIGADIVPSYLELARESYGDTIKFVQTTPGSIPLADESVDVVYTIDTVEHLSRAEEVFREVFRLLRPGGLFLVHFNPWLNPYGSHLEDIIAFPWPHLVFSMDTLLTVAAKVYDSPAYPTACYFLDPKTGEKRPNPYHNRENWETYLNRMTIRRFNRLLKRLPFEKVHQERIGFGGKTFKLSRFLRGLAQVPVMDELFTNALFTVLVKPPTRQK
jgi:SAM-dependent methyltransferase